MATKAIGIASSIASLMREGLRHIEGRGHLVNEATTLDILIKPTLEALGFPASYRFPEHGNQQNRLDDSCYLRPITSSPGHAALIVEAKEYGTDFDKVPPSQPSTGSPDRQIQRYLKQHVASGPKTLGVLTDGIRWRIYRRTGNSSNPDIELLAEHDFQNLRKSDQGNLIDLQSEVLENLNSLVDLLSLDSLSFQASGLLMAVPSISRADLLFASIAENLNPENIVREMLNEPNALIQKNLEEDVSLHGVRKDALEKDWLTYAYTKGVSLKTDTPSLIGNRAVVAAVRHRYVQSRGLARPDVALCASTFAGADPSNVAVLFAYSESPGGTVEARLAVAVGGQVNMTATFDPTLPSPSARASLEQLLQMLHQPPENLTADKLLAPLEAAPLRQQFYREVAQWVGRRQKGQDLGYRQAVLRHLVRVMFAWILKEENIIPQELFERAFVAAHLTDTNSYHGDVLRFLFHQRLNVPELVRNEHPNQVVNAAMEPVPFLNGSLFAEHEDDDRLQVPAIEYWSTDEKEPGLFTVFSRYHWTMDEHRPGESEQTLDPELLGNLFERLITPTQEGIEPPLLQPQGTYYTPADVADEMVKDALAAAVRNYVPSNVTDFQLLQFFGGADERLDELGSEAKAELAIRIKALRIFDPAVGSGEFLFSMLVALRRALEKLEPDATNPVAEIIRNQLAGQDINPLAVQITRLRLFIAITAARRLSPGKEPLPNLEARIVCADTLATVADPNWRPERPGQLTDAAPELMAALTLTAENRARWFDAHTEEDKQELLQKDNELRNQLRILLQQRADLASPELVEFAESPIYDGSPRPSRADARLLFFENDWRGFDIVIGNPPYEALSKSTSVEGRKQLADEKRYKTTNIGNLYSLFCEAALALANPNRGVITMIVPLSIAFGQRQKSLRDLMSVKCRGVFLRHYDNRPDTTFNASPTVKSPENRQRATIFTAKVGRSADQSVLVSTTGLQRWHAAERQDCMTHRQMTPVPKLGGGIDVRISGQWLRVPTAEVSELVEAITTQELTEMKDQFQWTDGESESGEFLALPKTAYRFIAAIPAGSVSPRSEDLLRTKNGEHLRLLMAVLNGHVSYAWWWMVGDGFHVKPGIDIGTFLLPRQWSENPGQAIELGQELIDAIPSCTVVNRQQGDEWQNVNFYLKPVLMEELDRLHLEALGFKGVAQDKLLRHLRTMRSASSWDFD